MGACNVVLKCTEGIPYTQLLLSVYPESASRPILITVYIDWFQR